MRALRNEESRRAKRRDHPRELLVECDERVIIESVLVNGRELTRYAIVTRDEWIEALPEDTPESVRVALSLAGAWSDLDWNETVESLDRIRHESVPTPPIEFDDDNDEGRATYSTLARSLATSRARRERFT